MTKEDLKKLIQEVYKEVASEPKAEKAKAEKPKSAPATEKPAVKKVAKVAKAVAPKSEDPLSGTLYELADINTFVTLYQYKVVPFSSIETKDDDEGV